MRMKKNNSRQYVCASYIDLNLPVSVVQFQGKWQQKFNIDLSL